jgi:hyaluronan synthase
MDTSRSLPGVEFVETLEPSDIAGVAISERRRYPRQSVDCCVTLKRVGRWRAPTVSARLRNISEKGAYLDVDSGESLAVGTRVLVALDAPPGGWVAEGWPSSFRGVVIRSGKEGAGAGYAIRFEETLREQSQTKRSGVERTIIVLSSLLLLGTIGTCKYFNYRWFWYDPWFQAYSLGVAAYIFTRAALCMFYKAPGDNGHMPTVTMAVAVKNEEANIASTLDSLFQSAYPAHLFEVIVVDDGSTDKTWEELKAAQKRYPRLRAFRFGVNKGKRHAMALGAQQASGDILIYVDSDTCVEKESVYRLVQPFVDSTIGAVAGHIQVIVQPNWILSKMERVRYFVSHRVIKACESMFGAVTCCSGAFSAYRREAVLRVMPQWLNQMFLGTRATFGDDRSLTNFILRDFRVVFHNDAVSWTYAPETWPKFFRQQLRWKKSWTRETIAAAHIMWRKHPVASFSYYMGVVMTVVSPLIVLRAMFYMPLMAGLSPLPYFGGIILIYLFFCLYFRYHTGSPDWIYGLGFAFLYIFVLCWQNYYAMLTVNRTHWGTR